MTLPRVTRDLLMLAPSVSRSLLVSRFARSLCGHKNVYIDLFFTSFRISISLLMKKIDIEKVVCIYNQYIVFSALEHTHYD